NAWVRVDTINGVTFTRDANNNFVQAVNYAFQAGVRDTLVISDATNDASLPVELAFFRGRSNEGKIMLEWRTESETNNAYWLLQRREITADELEKINSGLMKLSDVQSAYVTVNNIRGQGSKTSATEYSQMDTDVKAGKSYAYRLADVSYNGVITYHDDIMIASELPKKFGLRQNYPNPFNPTTTVKFELPVAAKVSIKIYNILGQEVYTLVDKTMGGGFYEAQWNGINKHNAAVASGVYIYRILATSLEGKQRFTQTKKMMIVK
ncbi:T9SS type A sorting domain-containing protein, partial [bacterium]|nr:T9SS type A sorting domain-containing protein [bacterium]